MENFNIIDLIPNPGEKININLWQINKNNNIKMEGEQNQASGNSHNNNNSQNVYQPSTSFTLEYDGNKDTPLIQSILSYVKEDSKGKPRAFSYALFFEPDPKSKDNKGKFTMLVQYENSSRLKNGIDSLTTVKKENNSMANKGWKLCKKCDLISSRGSFRGRGHSVNKINHSAIVINRSELNDNAFKKVKLFSFFGKEYRKYITWLSKYFTIFGLVNCVVEYDDKNKIFKDFTENTRVVFILYNQNSVKIPVDILNAFVSNKISGYNCGEGEFYNLVTNFLFVGEQPLKEMYSAEEFNKIVSDIEYVNCAEIDSWKSPESKIMFCNLLVDENN